MGASTRTLIDPPYQWNCSEDSPACVGGESESRLRCQRTHGVSTMEHRDVTRGERVSAISAGLR